MTVSSPFSADDQGPPEAGAQDRAPAERYLRGSLVALLVGAAGVHFAMAPDHFAEYWLFGVFFVATAWAQLALAAALVVRPGRRLFRAGLALQVAVVVLWVVTRTVGLPIGPARWAPESVAAVDALCTAFEVAAVVCFAALLAPVASARRVGWEAGSAAVGAVGALVLVLSSFALTPTGVGAHSMSPVAAGMVGMTGADAARGKSTAATNAVPPAGGAESAASGASSRAVYASSTTQLDGMTVPVLAGGGVLAGAAVPGCAMRQMRMAGHAAGACTDAPVTNGQRLAAEQLVLRTRAAVVNLPTLKTAYAAGYKDSNISGPLYHVVNYRYLLDSKVLDPEAIESLVYYKAPTGGSMLLGAMYIAAPASNGPLVGGALTPWHAHTNLCVNNSTGTAFNPRRDGSCAPGSSVQPTAQMLHVWTVDYPGGPFGELETAPITTAITGAILARGGYPTGA